MSTAHGNTVLYDAGLLVAADRGDRNVWADHKARLELDVLPATTAPVVAQVSRSSRQVQLHRLLRGCRIHPFAPDDPHPVGKLLAATRTGDVVDAHLVRVAGDGATIHTCDPDDLRRLANSARKRLHIRKV